ncbi:MAG: sodium:calcium antiporter, partial [Clostridiales bacterium]|nr:sodium:calcium antiporter [Clostridiales bacterium]
MVYVWLVVGFILLVKGADFFVDGSASIARLLRVPSVVVGLTIVAMGTSA